MKTPRLYWLSFATDEAFFGVVIIEAKDPATAFERATSRGLNAGGQVLAIQIPEEYVDHAWPYRNRLMTDKAEIERTFGPRGDPKDSDRLVDERPDVATVICEHCNRSKCGCA